MRILLLRLVGIALLQTIGCILADRDSFRAVIRLAGGIAMIVLLLGSITSVDYDAYAAALRHGELLLQDDALQNEKERLDRLYIEQECAAYILKQAQELGVTVSDVHVSLSWCTDGYWYPSAVELDCPNASDPDGALSDRLTSDLGIPRESQCWREEGSSGS